MAREPISQEKLDHIIKLHKEGYSWRSIDSATKVPRRTAKAAYEKWEREKSLGQLMEVRREVAADELRGHIDDLVRMAVALLDTVTTPELPSERRKAGEVLDSLFRREIHKESSTSGDDWVQPGRGKSEQRIVRQNHMLLESLKAHTQEKSAWQQALSKWENDWDQCVKSLEELTDKTKKSINSFIRQEPRLLKRIEDDTGTTDVVDRILEGILLNIWPVLREGKPGRTTSVFDVHSRNKYYIVSTGGFVPDLPIKFTEKKLAGEVAKICNSTAKLLYTTKAVVLVLNYIGSMQTSIGILEKSLDPIVIRPLILRTYCDLCPV